MTGKDDKPMSESDRQFAEQAKALFDESVDGLDAASQSKLNQARQAAVAELRSDSVRLGRWNQWVPATGAPNLNNANPINAIVGAMVMGPTKRSILPTAPE